MSQQLQITGGAKVRDLQDVIIGTSGVLSSLAFNVANGVPKLDVNGKILVSQLPNSVMEYQGTWNAATNTPTLVNGTGNQGDVYLCNVAGTTNFGAGPITFAVGDSAIYSGTIWQRAGGATGTVTSVGLTSTGNDAITITGSPITTSGNINLGFAGTNLQYINGAGDLTTFPTLISSIGLTMPSAFSVANSPLTSNGTIAVTGAGYPSQYIRGDGTLADFPTSGGGGSSVSYYLNGGTSQGTIGGVTYYEMSKTADTGTGVDFTKSGDGFIVAFLTDAGDPAQLNIPAGNWNYEIYASMSANGGTPEMYAELYKYDGTTFTLISTSSNEILYDGTNLNLYTFAMTVPSTTLAITNRLAVKLYATNSGGKTTTVHTQDSHLCQIITTFSTGITALNGLTAQVQYFATGTSGTDFNISSTTATHTFNIPSASATNRGLITTGSQTIAGNKTFTGENYFSLVNMFDQSVNYKTGGVLVGVSGYISQGYDKTGTGAGSTLSMKIADGNSVKNISLDFVGSPVSTPYTYTFPAASGTISLLESNQTFTGLNTFSSVANMTASLQVQQGLLLNQGIQASALAPYTAISGYANGLFICPNSGTGYYLVFPTSSSYVYTFPAATGTLALTSNLSSYVPYTGATADLNTGNFSIFSNYLDLKNALRLNGDTYNGAIVMTSNKGGQIYATTNAINITPAGIYLLDFTFGGATGGAANLKNFRLDVTPLTLNQLRTYTMPDASGTLALTSDLGSYLPLTGGTLTGQLYINPTNTATVGLDVASNTTRFRSDNLEGNKRQLEITMGSGTLVQMTAKGFGADYGTDLAFYSSTSGGVNSNPAIYITGTNNRVGIGTGSPTSPLSVRSTTNTNMVSLGISGTQAVGDAMGITFTSSIYEKARIVAYNENTGNAAGYLTFWTGGSPATTDITERMRITSAGNVGIGGTPPTLLYAYSSTNTAEFRLERGGAGDVGMRWKRNSADLGYISNADWIIAGASSTDFGVTAVNNLVFGTAGTARLIIGSTGGAKLNTSNTTCLTVTNGDASTSFSDLQQIRFGYGNTTEYAQIIHTRHNGGTGTNNAIDFYCCTGTAANTVTSGSLRVMTLEGTGLVTIVNLGSGAVTSTGGVLSATSDMNLKISDGYIDSALDKILKLTPRYFYWKEETGLPTDLRQLGFEAGTITKLTLSY